MDKLYERINWENEPSVSSPINATNLNKIDYAVDELDNRVISLDTTKISKAETASDIVNVSLDEDTGIFTFTRRDGSTLPFDTKLEKITTNWTFDEETQKIILTLNDGTKQEIDLSKLITIYEFLDSDTIAFSVNGSGKVSAIVKNGAIKEAHLQPNFLADIKVESAKAETASASASVSAQEAKQYRDEAEQFRNEAKSFAPEGYVELQETVASNTVKIDTIIEKAELNIKNSAKGDNLHLTDSANSKVVAFGLYGKAGQKQYSGKNLLKLVENTSNLNGLTPTVKIDGSLNILGTPTQVWANLTNANVNIKAGTYIFSISEPLTHVIGVKVTTQSGSVNYPIWSGQKTTTFTTEEDITKLIVYIEGLTIGTAINEVVYSMIRLASITDDTYEPYVGGIPSPNPDYPQEITVSGSDGSVEVVSCGKNLWNNTVKSQTLNDVSIIVNDDKSIKFNGTASKNGALLWGTNATDYNIFLRKGNYILSAKSTSTMPSGTLNLRDSNETVIVSINLMSQQEKGFTIQSDVYCRAFLNMNNGNVYNNVTIYPMIRFASDTDDTYKPYKETTSTIPTPNGLCGIKVESGGNYTDENGQQWIADEIVKYADGSGKRIQRVGKVVFDGSDDEGWLINTTSDNSKKRLQTNSLKALIKNTTLNTTKSTLLCDKFIATKPQENYNATNGIIQHNGSVFVYSDYFNTNDVTLWTAYLAENPMTVLYELETPTITDLTAEEIAEIEKLYTFYPITNISNDADCGMSITYMADAKNYIDNRLALIESAMLNNI